MLHTSQLQAEGLFSAPAPLSCLLILDFLHLSSALDSLLLVFSPVLALDSWLLAPFHLSLYMENIAENYLSSAKQQFRYYKSVGDRAMATVSEEQMHWQYNNDSNSIAVIIKHVAGNCLSRWTDFLNSDGEKDWRDRDAEFEGSASSKDELIALWEKGWQCLFDAIDPLTGDDLARVVYIRNEGHTVIEAINRQLAHLPYHVGQIVYLAKMVSAGWQSLTIPKGKSAEFNTRKFLGEKDK